MSGIALLGSRLLDALFPPRCVSCGTGGALLCARCLATIHAPAPPLCATCGRSLSAASARGSPSAAICAFCAAGERPAFLDGLRAACVYESAARQAILALKFRGQRRLAQPLAEWLATCYRREELRAEFVLPVPLHRGRRRQRGYDQAELLARSLGRQLRLPVRTDLLARARETAPQTSLSREERRSNVAGAFALAAPAATQALAGKRLVLVDDVSTTGSTLEAAAAALREANPESIWGLAVARPDLTSDGAADVDLGASHAFRPGRDRRVR